MIGVLSEFQYKSFFQNPLPLLLKIARYLEEDLEFYRILINSNGANAFLIKLKNILSPLYGKQQRCAGRSQKDF